MPDYKYGKVYAIRSHQTDKVYVGSTTTPLYVRMAKHRFDCKNKRNGITSFEILKNDDAYIELLENFPCNSKEELNRKEGEYIRLLNCVNKCISGRTGKEYYQDNKVDILAKRIDHYQDNKERVKAYKKAYRAKKNEIENK